MIILDTNVVSEPLKLKPDPAVLQWLDRQAPETLSLTAISVSELLAGVEILPTGRRRNKIHAAIVEQVLPLFDGRILAFDLAACEFFARANARAQAAGNPISFADGAIAAIAAAHGFMLATRNERDFKGTGVKLINPWTV
jgi:toxin FitB